MGDERQGQGDWDVELVSLTFPFLPSYPSFLSFNNPIPSHLLHSTLLSTPIHGPALPNAAGTLILYTTRTYSLSSHAEHQQLCRLDVESGVRTVLREGDEDGGVGEPAWLGVRDLYACLVTSNDDDGGGVRTRLFVGDAGMGKTHEEAGYVAAEFKGIVEGLKVVVLDHETIRIVVAGQCGPDGNLLDPSSSEGGEKLDTGRLYTKLPVRRWDAYVTETRNALFLGTLKLIDGRFRICRPLTNILRSVPGLECPIPPFGDMGQYDISVAGIVFVAKDPRAKRMLPASNVYFVPFEEESEDQDGFGSLGRIKEIKISGLHGASSYPTFSPDGKSLAFLRMRDEGYESDRNRIVLVPDVRELDVVRELDCSDGEKADGINGWDRSPASLTWSQDGKDLFVTAPEHGRMKLFKIDVQGGQRPVICPLEGSVAAVKTCGESESGQGEMRIVVSSSTFGRSCVYTLFSGTNALRSLLYQTDELKPAPEVSEIWYPSTRQSIHAFVVKPPNFDPSKKYPFLLLIHGGPQYAWLNSFAQLTSGIYNPCVFAAAGYVVLLPNIIGSIGYGQAFTDAITGDWGGQPYADLENAMAYVKENMAFVDLSRVAALGSSWGGYMIYHLAGLALSSSFRCLISDSGIFNLPSFAAATDEPWFPEHDFGGKWFEAAGQRNLERWDPKRRVGEWRVPMLIVHNERDYRHPVGDALAAFGALGDLGIEGRFLTFEGEAHGVVGVENVRRLYGEVIAWVGKFVGDGD